MGKTEQAIDGFLEDFEMTNDKEDYVIVSAMEEWRKRKNMSMSNTKWGIDLKKRAALQGFDRVVSVPKKVNKKTLQVWEGIRMVVDDDGTSDVVFDEHGTSRKRPRIDSSPPTQCHV